MKLTVASSPHIRGNFATRRIMADVMIALAPALAVGVARFGTKALILTLCAWPPPLPPSGCMVP